MPWPGPEETLYRTTLPNDYLALARPLGIETTIVVEASPWLEDNQWILDLAATEPAITGFVGNFSEVLGKPSFESALATYAANPQFRGIRVGAKQLNLGGADGFRLLADKGLVVDVLVRPSELASVARFARELGSLRIVVDHVGGVAIDGKVPASDWMSGMAQLESTRNVYCKTSGLVEGSGMANAPTDVSFYRPVLDVVWQAFGEDRLVFASNWPVSAQFAPLSTVLSIAKQYFEQQGDAALQKVLSENAQAVYRR